MTKIVAGLLLAAGQSSRFGSNKLIHPVPGGNTPMVLQAAQNLLSALPNSFAVIRPDDDEVRSLLTTVDIGIIENPDADAGMSSSICCGVQKLVSGNNTIGCMVALADMPYIQPTIYTQVSASISSGKLICAPEYRSKRGHPVGFSHSLYSELLMLKKDVGAKSLINKYRDRLHLVSVDTDSILRDIDSPNDLP